MYKNGDGTRSMAFVTLCNIDQVGRKSLILCDIIFEQLISIYKIHPKSNYILNCIAYNTKSASSSFSVSLVKNIKGTYVKFHKLFYLHYKWQYFKTNSPSSGDPKTPSFLLVICRMIINAIKIIDIDNN